VYPCHATSRIPLYGPKVEQIDPFGQTNLKILTSASFPASFERIRSLSLLHCSEPAPSPSFLNLPFSFFQFQSEMRSMWILGYVLFAGMACALDNYIIVMKPNSPVGIIDTILKTLLGGLVVGPLQRFSIGTAFNGFTCPLTTAQVTLLQLDPSVSKATPVLLFRYIVCGTGCINYH
jgi:hypothetical protein